MMSTYARNNGIYAIAADDTSQQWVLNLSNYNFRILRFYVHN